MATPTTKVLLGADIPQVVGDVKAAVSALKTELRDLEKEAKRQLRETGKIADDLGRKLESTNERLKGAQGALNKSKATDARVKELRGLFKDAKDYKEVGYGLGQAILYGDARQAIRTVVSKDFFEIAEKASGAAGKSRLARVFGIAGRLAGIAAAGVEGVTKAYDIAQENIKTDNEVRRSVARGELDPRLQRRAAMAGYENDQATLKWFLLGGLPGAARYLFGKSNSEAQQEELKRQQKAAGLGSLQRAEIEKYFREAGGPEAEYADKKAAAFVRERDKAIYKKQLQLGRGLNREEIDTEGKVIAREQNITDTTLDFISQKKQNEQDEAALERNRSKTGSEIQSNRQEAFDQQQRNNRMKVPARTFD